MNLQAEKLEIMKLVLETNNPNILESIKKLFKKSKSVDFWDTLTKEQKNEIQEGINEADRGDVDDYEKIMKKHR